ncbi:AAA family ATPase [Candidatus Woesearchaeota archaeon]|nr:AAA family ATPase [Candidatus Woesearchaeota archaeon]
MQEVPKPAEPENFALYRPKLIQYIARAQPDAFDEIQRMLMSIENQHPVGLEGEPGTGKNQLIDFLASARGKSVGRVRCTEELTLESLLGKERIRSERAEHGVIMNSIYEEGIIPLTYAAGADLVLDEFNQLLPTVQKGMNSMFEDKKTICVDGKHREKKGDGATYVTFNPKTGVTGQDLEKAVKDRLKIIPLPEIPLELQARITLIKTGIIKPEEIIDEAMEQRAIITYEENGRQKYQFLEKQGKVYVEYRTGREAKKGELREYLFYTGKESSLRLTGAKNEAYKVAQSLVALADDVNKFKNHGTSVFDDDFNQALGLDQVSKIGIESGGLRIIAKVMEDYALMTERGQMLDDILPTLARTYLDNICTLEMRHMPIGKKDNKDISIYEVLETMAAKRGFFPIKRHKYASIAD